MLLHVFPSFAVGGAQIRLARLANHFGRSCRHAILALDGDVGCRARLDPDLEVRFPAVDTRKHDLAGNLLRARRLLAALRPHRLVTYNWGSIEWAITNLLAGLAHVHIEDGFGPEERSRQLPRRVWMRRLVLRRSAVVLPSRTLQRIALETWRLPPRRLHYIPNGIDLDRFIPGPAGPTPWDGAGEGPVIGTVAALRAEKNLSRLLQAFALLRRDRTARLVIVGDGPERPALQRLAGELGIAGAVHFAGQLAAPETAYRHFDLFALSSDTEQMPLSLLEAMAAGLPTAATAVGDVAEMLAAGNRAFVVPPDATALAGAMAALLDAPERRRALGAANRLRAEREYGQAAMFRRYATVLGLPA